MYGNKDIYGTKSVGVHSLFPMYMGPKSMKVHSCTKFRVFINSVKNNTNEVIIIIALLVTPMK